MTKLVTIIMLVLLLSGVTLHGQQIRNWYSPGDWVTYTTGRYVTTIARGFNTIYFGTTEGILRYDIIRDQWLDPITTSDGLPENKIRRLAVDRLTDDIWVETPNFTAYYNPTFQIWQTGEPFPSDKVSPPGPSPSSFPQLFVNKGYNYFTGGTMVGHDLINYQITTTFQDEDGTVWVGIWGLGPGKVDLTINSLDIMQFGPYDSDIAALTVAGEDVWMLGGGYGMPGVISHFDRTADDWEYFDPHYNPNIVSDQFYVIRSDSNNLWIGTELGLVRYNERRRSFSSFTESDGIYGQRVTSVLPIKNNVIIGTDVGISVYDIKRDSIYVASSDNIRNHVINDLAIGGKVIYAATDYGVYTLTIGGSAWERFQPSALVLQQVVTEVQVVDSLLYTSGDDGVVVYNLNTDDYKLYDRNTVFKNADLRVLLVYQGFIWVGGNDGLFRLNNRTGTWYHYQPADGLASYTVTSLSGDGHHIWIGTDKGATRFLWDNFGRSDWKE